MNELGAEKYVSLTTFTKDGRPKPTPVWIADLSDGTIGFTTGLDAWKVKRIRNTPRVELAPSDARGNVADDAITTAGTAEIRTGAAYDPVERAIKAKYGWQFTAITGLERLKRIVKRTPATDGGGTCAVVITLDPAD
ncbi:MAG: PPOX class F420-dependent oxidoreductase [Actinomycetota bacterium]